MTIYMPIFGIDHYIPTNAADDVYYREGSFIFWNLDYLKIDIKVIPYKAENYPISIGVGFCGKAPAET